MSTLSSIPNIGKAPTTLGVERRLPRWVMPILFVAIFAGTWGGLAAMGHARFIYVLLVGAIIFLLVSWLLPRVYEGGRWAMDTFVKYLVYLAFAIAIIPLASLLWTVITRGISVMDVEFLTTDMTGIYGDIQGGGILHGIVGTLWITVIAAAIAVPLGIFTAIYLVEYSNNGPLSRGITTLVDVMTGIPSIVAGLFAYSLFVMLAGPGYKAGIIGSVALAVLMTPLVVRQTEEMLRLVPNSLRWAALALGVPKWRMITKVVLRTAIAGITTGVMIALARVTGETAPLLVTVGTITTINSNPLDGRMATLPVLAYRFYAQGDYDRAWGTALVLLLIVMILNLIARFVSKKFAPKGLTK